MKINLNLRPRFLKLAPLLGLLFFIITSSCNGQVNKDVKPFNQKIQTKNNMKLNELTDEEKNVILGKVRKEPLQGNIPTMSGKEPTSAGNVMPHCISQIPNFIRAADGQVLTMK
jgi:hypothetical protein